MTTQRLMARRGVAAVVSGIAAIGLLASCAGGPGSATAAVGEGVSVGSSKAEFAAAFENVEPIELIIQSAGTPGSTASAMIESYINSVTEWSGGKITFEHIYSNAVAGVLDSDNALADGRLDVAAAAPANEPQEYPASAALNSMSFMGDQDPLINAMATHAWGNELAMSTPAVAAEYEAMGLHVLVPYYTGGTVGLFCADPVDDVASLHGRQVGTSTSAQKAQVESLGMVAVSLPFSEAFESLERGVIDCTVQSFRVGGLIKLIDVAPHVIVNPTQGWGLSMGGLAIGKERWDELPLVAQQVLHDRSVDFILADVKGVLESVGLQVAAMNEAGVKVQTFDESGEAQLADANGKILNTVAKSSAVGDGTEAFVERGKTLVPEWQALLAQMGYESKAGINDFATWWDANELDLEPYADALFERVYNKSRPGN